MENKGYTLEVLPGTFAVCKLLPDAAIPAWLRLQSSFWSITRSAEEYSIVCEEELVPEAVVVEGSWKALKVAGKLDFSLTGVLAGIADPLRDAGISIFALSTFDTDYVLVKAAQLALAEKALEPYFSIRRLLD